MSEDAKELSPEEKLWAVKEYLSGKGSTYSIADKNGVTDTSIRRWVDRYKIDGETAFHRKIRHPLCQAGVHTIRAFITNSRHLASLLRHKAGPHTKYPTALKTVAIIA